MVKQATSFRNVEQNAFCYLLRSRKNTGVPCDEEWLEREAPKAQCARCAQVSSGHYPRPIDQVLEAKPLGVGADCRMGGFLWKRDLLVVLGPWLMDCVLGRVLLRKSGRTVELLDWATCYMKPGCEIFDSRGKLARHEPCPLCGSLILVNGATAQRIVRRDIRPDRIAMTDWGTIYLHPAIESAIDWKPFRDAYRGKVKLIEEPEDGQCLPGDPDWAPGKTRLAQPPAPGQPKYIDDPDDLDPPVLYD